MNLKRILITALVSLVAAGLVCVVLVGMINGVWPWSGSIFGADYTGPRPSETTETTTETEETSEATTEASVPTTTVDEEEKSSRPTLENKIPVDVIVTEPTQGNGSEGTDITKPSDNNFIDFNEMYNPNKE